MASVLFSYSTSRALAYLLATTLMAGCGGGSPSGGGDGSSGVAPPVPVVPVPVVPVPVPPTPTPTLTFSVPTAAATADEGSTKALSLLATVNTPSDFQNANSVFAYVIDTTGVILPEVQFSQLSSSSYSILLQTAPTLPIGKHTGTFSVKVCKNAACTQHFPGSPMQLPYAITVVPIPLSPMTVAPLGLLNATISAGNPAPAPVTVNVSAKSRTWTVNTNAAWIKLSTAAGNGVSSFTVGYDVSALAPGVQTGTVVVTSSDGQIDSLPVSAELLPAAFSIDHGQITFNGINGAPIAAAPVKFTVANLAANWKATASAAWLGVTPTSGTTPAIASVYVDPANGKLASGRHDAMLTITAPNVSDSKVPVTLNLTKATLTPSIESITLGGPYGRSPASTASLTLNLNTMANAYPWSFSALPAWLGASATSGTVNQAGSNIVFSQIGATQPIGTSTTTLTASTQVNGDTISVPVTITAQRDTRKLLFSEVGVGLSSTPGWSRLSRKVTVRDNFGLTPAWTASSDKAWLTVQRSGNALTLTADPSTLPVDAISYATVSLASETGIQTSEQLHVAIWKGSVTPAVTTKLTKTYSHLKTDPIRPLLYANNGAGNIDVYNIYSATQIGTISNLGAAMGDMTISPNGQHLYTYDTANRNIIVVDLATLTKKTSWPMAAAVQQSSALLALRPNGVEIVAAADGKAYLASTGAVVGMISNGDSMAASSDGSRLYLQDSGYSPASVSAIAVDYADIGGGALFSASVASAGFINRASNGQDIAVSADGMRLYVASGAPYRCSSVKPSDLSFIGSLSGGDAYPNNVEVGSDDRVYCGISGWYSSADVWVHDANGTLLKSFKFAGYARNLMTRTLGISADGLMMVGQTDDPLLVFVPVGP